MIKNCLPFLIILLLLNGCTPKSETETAEENRMRYVIAYDTGTGEQLYKKKYGQEYAFAFATPLGPVYEGKLILGTADKEGKPFVSALEVSTGKELWLTEVAREEEPSISTIPQTLFLARHGVAGQLDPVTGKLVESKGELLGTPFAWRDGKAYSATKSEVIATDTEAWKELWSAEVAGVDGAIVADDGTGIFTNPNGCRAFKESGEPAWELKTDYDPAKLAKNSSTVFLSTAEPRIIALNPANGEKLWEQGWKGQDNFWDAPLVGEKLLVTVVGENILALDISTGEEKWKVPRGRGDIALDQSSNSLYSYHGNSDEIVRHSLEDGKELSRSKLDVNVTRMLVDGNKLLLETVDKPAEDVGK